MPIKIPTIACLAFTLAAAAVHAGADMTEEQMQQMMQQAEQMQKCMTRVDESELEIFGARAEVMEQEINALCDAGQRDQAQQLALEYGKQISNSNVMQELKQCGDMAQVLLEQLPGLSAQTAEADDLHVCDAR
ncbi:MAG: hypothetical protein WD572_10545 [Gammaproteobacteria bacterium]